MKFLIRLLKTYDYNSIQEFILSLFPSYKYKLQGLSLLLSFITTTFHSIFGIGPLIAFAMLIAILIEVRTGIKASRKEGKNFESFRFSRCIIKLFIWLAIFFIIHSFEKEFVYKPHEIDILTYLFFKIVFVMALAFFCVEHITSIAENCAVIEGKPKDHYIKQIQVIWKNFTDNIFKKLNP